MGAPRQMAKRRQQIHSPGAALIEQGRKDTEHDGSKPPNMANGQCPVPGKEFCTEAW